MCCDISSPNPEKRGRSGALPLGGWDLVSVAVIVQFACGRGVSVCDHPDADISVGVVGITAAVAAKPGGAEPTNAVLFEQLRALLQIAEELVTLGVYVSGNV